MEEKIAVSSRDIAIIGYDINEKRLEIAFRAGGVYRYEGVSEDLFMAFRNAESHGRFFQEHIKGRYSYNKVNLN